MELILIGQWWFGQFGPFRCKMFNREVHGPRPFFAVFETHGRGKVEGVFADTIGEARLSGTRTADKIQLQASYYRTKTNPMLEYPVSISLKRQRGGWIGYYSYHHKEMGKGATPAAHVSAVLEPYLSGMLVPRDEIVFPDRHRATETERDEIIRRLSGLSVQTPEYEAVRNDLSRELRLTNHQIGTIIRAHRRQKNRAL